MPILICEISSLGIGSASLESCSEFLLTRSSDGLKHGEFDFAILR